VTTKPENLKLDVADAVSRYAGRRALIKGAATLLGGVSASAMLAPIAAEAATKKGVSTPQSGNAQIIANDENAIVETTAGKVRG
jgi:hypothetical protein